MTTPINGNNHAKSATTIKTTNQNTKKKAVDNIKAKDVRI